MIYQCQKMFMHINEQVYHTAKKLNIKYTNKLDQKKTISIALT